MSRFPAAFRLPALASWPSFARWGAGPSSRSAYRSLNSGPDPDGVVTLRTPEMRPGWVPSVPRGLRYPHGWRDSPPAARRLSTAGPYTPALRPIAEAYSNEASPRVHRCSPVRPSPRL